MQHVTRFSLTHRHKKSSKVCLLETKQFSSFLFVHVDLFLARKKCLSLVLSFILGSSTNTEYKQEGWRSPKNDLRYLGKRCREALHSQRSPNVDTWSCWPLAIVGNSRVLPCRTEFFTIRSAISGNLKTILCSLLLIKVQHHLFCFQFAF